MNSFIPTPRLTRAHVTALDDGVTHWSYDALDHEVALLAVLLVQRQVRVLATLADNSPAWVVADLAAAQAGVVHVPLPVFFTPAQCQHALASAGCDTLLATLRVATQQLPGLGPLEGIAEATIAGQPHWLIHVRRPAVPLPPRTAKITFTSGTTGTPKGVCLDGGAMARVAEGLATAMAPLHIERHLCALPLPVLLENIAGLMAPLSRGATCIVPPLAELGLKGSSSFDAAAFQRAVLAHQPHSLILLPQMLRAWAAHLHQTHQHAPDSLRLVAVGGAAVGTRTLALARAVGIPAHEGYGLSEGASVQTLNLPGADRPGSAGRALPHAQIRCAADGEIEVAGSLFLGYVGDTPQAPRTWWPTGDLGHIDADGYLHIEGRKKHVLITAFGRNVAPEWVEAALRGEPAVLQAVVLGDGEPQLCAVLWPSHPDATGPGLQAAVDAANQHLPDYARIGRWVCAQAPFSAESGLATANGRPRRELIQRMHAEALGLAPAIAPT